jgi:hypothetical protein
MMTKKRKIHGRSDRWCQTEPAFGSGSTRTVAQGEANLEALCTNVKAKGITVITIAYDLDDNATTKRLKAVQPIRTRISSSQPYGRRCQRF